MTHRLKIWVSDDTKAGGTAHAPKREGA